MKLIEALDNFSTTILTAGPFLLVGLVLLGGVLLAYGVGRGR